MGVAHFGRGQFLGQVCFLAVAANSHKSMEDGRTSQLQQIKAQYQLAYTTEPDSVMVLLTSKCADEEHRIFVKHTMFLS